ncbi:hypothetical protein KFK09_011846 [Dendrobium nobile]|uniref:WAT1-related protein n=1 Tax=Dendrobium nobile TaxID=94219 RepID=A0A8T3BH19_DENNO|nr:hypothetical protein KFK09_011846 [Dendrobium nobile]
MVPRQCTGHPEEANSRPCFANWRQKQKQRERERERGAGQDETVAKLDEHKQVLAIVLVQIIFAFMAIFTKAALTAGLRPMTFVFYRQSIAAPMLIPTSVFSRGESIAYLSLGCKASGWSLLLLLLGLEIPTKTTIPLHFWKHILLVFMVHSTGTHLQELS